MAVPVDGTGTASVEPVMAPPVQGMQKPHPRVGKWFRDCLKAVPKRKGKRPAGLKMRPACCSRTAWALTRQSSAVTRAARLGVCSRAVLEAADGDDLVAGPDSDGEGAGSVAQNSIGAVVERLERWDDAAMTDPDEGGGEELSWQLAGQLDTRIVPRQGRSRIIQSF